jgi:DNA-binding MarR family transcriptional regulator
MRRHHGPAKQEEEEGAAPPGEVEAGQVGAALARLAQAMRSLLGEGARAAGLTPTQAQALLSLLAAEGPLTAGALAEDFGASAPTLSEVLNTLERKGLVERRHGLDDRRLVQVLLTEPGRRVATRVAGWDGLLAAAIRHLPAAERAAFFRAVIALLAELQQHEVVRARVCPACAYFVENCDGDARRPFGCALSGLRLADVEFRVDCPDFVLRH